MHAVIFDVDGTLLQSVATDDDLYRESIMAVLGSVRLRPSFSDYDFVTDPGILSQILDDNEVRSDRDWHSEVKAHFVRALEAHIQEYGPFHEIAGAQAMLRSLLLSKESAVAIATGCWAASALLKLRSANFDLTGVPMVTADDFADRTEIMQLALSRLGAAFESITYYGDGPWDRDACATLGWRFVAVGPVLGGIDSYQELGEAS